jgi:hypothetical protein
VAERVCMHCGVGINFTRVREGWEWSAHLGSSVCAATKSGGRHYPTDPIEGIDY